MYAQCNAVQTKHFYQSFIFMFLNRSFRTAKKKVVGFHMLTTSRRHVQPMLQRIITRTISKYRYTHTNHFP